MGRQVRQTVARVGEWIHRDPARREQQLARGDVPPEVTIEDLKGADPEDGRHRGANE